MIGGKIMLLFFGCLSLTFGSLYSMVFANGSEIDHTPLRPVILPLSSLQMPPL